MQRLGAYHSTPHTHCTWGAYARRPPRNSEFSYPVLKMECYGVGLIKIGVEWTLDRRVSLSVHTVKISPGGINHHDASVLFSEIWGTRLCVAWIELNDISFFFSVESEGRAQCCLAKSFLKAKFDTGSDMANTNLLTFHWQEVANMDERMDDAWQSL